MDTYILLLIMGMMLLGAFALGRTRSFVVASGVGGIRFLNSLPFYYGMLALLWTGLPALLLFAIWTIFDSTIIAAYVLSSLPEQVKALPEGELNLILNQIGNLANGVFSGSDGVEPYMKEAADRIVRLRQFSDWGLFAVIFVCMCACFSYIYFKIEPQLKARVKVETAFRLTLLACSCIAIFTTVGIVLSVIVESLRFFSDVSIIDFLFGLNWSPQTAIREGQTAGESSFGAVPLFAGTLLIAFIAMVVAVPAGLMSAIYLSEYAPAKVRNIVKPLLEVLAGIPTVVYGFFAALTLAPLIRDLAVKLGLDQYVTVTSESALAAGLVMGVMIIPFVSSLADDVINAVPQSLRDGALGLGATQSEVIKQVVIPAALPGIVGGVLLAVSRAIGETMIVVMAAGLAANLTINPLDSVTTVTVQIVTILVGDQEFDSPKTLAAFALGLMLFVTTLALNYVALHVVKKYREQYE